MKIFAIWVCCVFNHIFVFVWRGGRSGRRQQPTSQSAKPKPTVESYRTRKLTGGNPIYFLRSWSDMKSSSFSIRVMRRVSSYAFVIKSCFLFKGRCNFLSIFLFQKTWKGENLICIFCDRYKRKLNFLFRITWENVVWLRQVKGTPFLYFTL